MTEFQSPPVAVLFTEPPVRSRAERVIPYFPSEVDLRASEGEPDRRTQGPRRIVEPEGEPHRQRSTEIAADFVFRAAVAFAALVAGGLTSFAMLMVGHLVG